VCRRPSLLKVKSKLLDSLHLGLRALEVNLSKVPWSRVEEELEQVTEVLVNILVKDAAVAVLPESLPGVKLATAALQQIFDGLPKS